MNPLYLIFASTIGFLVSAYILYSKKFNKPLYCPIGKECDAVVRSEYGKTFGVENTIPGMVYYILILIYGILLVLNQNLFKEMHVYYSIVGISVGAVAFSARLICIQAFVLKKWCYYCIISSIASISILILLLL